MKLKDWLMTTLFKNFGNVTGEIYRSGQMGRILLPFFVKRYGIKTIIALNMDGSNKRETFEMNYCVDHGIHHIRYNWSAGGNSFPGQLDHVVATLEGAYITDTPLLIHCAGGKDRTGGALGVWAGKYDHISKEYWMKMCGLYGIPSEGWLKVVFKSFSQ